MASAETMIFRARYLLPMSGPCVENGALLVRDGRIVEVGNDRSLKAWGDAGETVDFGEAILLPPMANAHTHLELTHVPYWDAFGQDREIAGFTDWMLRLIGVLRGVPQEEFGVSLRDGIRRSIRYGTGAIGDILSRIHARDAYVSTPLRGRLFLEALGLDAGRNRQTLDVLSNLLDQPAPGKMIYGLAPHSIYTVSADFLQQLFELASQRHLMQSMHVAESPEEVSLIRDGDGPFAERLYPQVGWGDRIPPARGLTPVHWLAQHRLLKAGDLLVHGVHVSAEEIELLADAGVYVVLCPRSNHRLGVGKAPVAAYRAAGVPLVLGTDSLASCDSLSVWDEVAFARQCFGEDLDAASLLEMATYYGACALGLAGEMGALAPGYGAHFQVLRPAQLPSLPDLPDFLCRPGRTDEVDALFLDGKPCNPSMASL
ncbi:metal-dependent hydrolase, subgroup D [Syntrophotalea carbinolica DSM 2380]|uniref:Metal-dependent hydrolase, subgroup D n=1 Tax=Syntrophotalea carbinolica (strain DSM 2380 / NBRC 103641 / GraBd1) TaxID=338963 RepID=Q3A3I9_SYNC1|nr:amidohydrolase family protein [Syntrophotalea carbinolica]ABA89068.1 metal-dependent hydrolase, subgroup D [Syntrophotalea carbinolica DSM 2380]